MRSLSFWKLCLLFFALAAVLPIGGCGDDDDPPPVTPPTPPPATTGTISGFASLPAGVPGDISNSLVSIYQNFDDWNNYRPLRSVASTGGPYQISFTFTNVTPGTYYLDVWKDMDISGNWTAGDFMGVYGSSVWPGPTPSPFSVAAGQTASTNVTLLAIPF